MEKNRIKNYRDKKIKEGYSQINIYLKNEDIQKIKKIKEITKKNYSEIFEMMLKTINVSSNTKKQNHVSMGVSEALEKVGEVLLVMTQERDHTKENAQARFFVTSHKIKCTIIPLFNHKMHNYFS